MRLAPAIALLLLAAPAVAAPTRDERLAALLAEGERLTKAADTGCAIPLEAAAREAEQSDDAYGRALAALALCREVQGRFAEAHALVSRALEGAPAETTPAGKAARWVTLRAARQRLELRVARLLVTWPEGTELYVDGKPAPGPSGRVMAIDPGRRLLEARTKDGRTVAAQHVEARAEDLPAVHLRAAAAAPAPSQSLSPTAPSSPRTPPTAPSSSPSQSPLVPDASR